MLLLISVTSRPGGVLFFQASTSSGLCAEALARVFHTAREFHPKTSAYCLVLLSLFFAVAFRGLGANLFVILFEGG